VNHRAAFIDFAAKAMNEDVDDISLRIETVVEDVLENHGLGDWPIGMAHQVLKQGEFARLEIDFFLAAMHFAFEEVHGEVADSQASGFGSLSCAANESLDAGEQFGERKWFGEVIVAAGLKPADSVIDSCLGAEDEDGCADVFVA
jgi:hypothetical protein